MIKNQLQTEKLLTNYLIYKILIEKKNYKGKNGGFK